MMDTKLKTLLILLVVLKEACAAPPCEGDCSSACTCYGKNLRNVPHNMPETMTTFRLQENSISALSQRDFSRYTKLEELYLYDNIIRTIQVGTFTPVPHLLVLYLSSNHLSSVPQGLFHGLNELQSLYLSYNRIESVQSFAVTDLPKLESLSLGNNTIHSISPDAFVNLPSLNYLFLGNNKLTEIPTVDMQFPSLANLFLYNNSIWQIPDDAFWNQPNLVALFLDTNKISYIAPKAFRGLDKLNRLHLFGNLITELPDSVFFGLSNLQTIRLQDNQISQLYPNTFGGIDEIQYLFLDYNNLWEFPIEALSKVEIYELRMTKNQMTTLSEEAYKVLSSVHWGSLIDNNPWHCDCKMAPFRKRMNVSVTYPDNYLSYQIICDSPGKFYGKQLTDIDPEDLTCDNATSVVLGTFFVILIIVAIVLVVRRRRRARKNFSSPQRSAAAFSSRSNSARGRGAAQGTGRVYRLSRPPTRPPPPRAATGRTVLVQAGNINRGAGASLTLNQPFVRQHNQFDPRKGLPIRAASSKPPSRPPPPLSVKSKGPTQSNTDTHMGATASKSSLPPRPKVGPGIHRIPQTNLSSKAAAFGHVHKPVTAPTSAIKQGARSDNFRLGNPGKESARSGQNQRTIARQQNRFSLTSGRKLSRHTSLAKCLPPSQPPPPPPSSSTASRKKDDDQAVPSNIFKGGPTLTDNQEKKVDQQSNKFNPQGRDSRHALRPAITRPKPSSKPMLLPRPTFQKSDTEGRGTTSKQSQKDASGHQRLNPSTRGGSGNIPQPTPTTSVPASHRPPPGTTEKPDQVSGSTSSETTTPRTSLQPRPANAKISSRIQAIQSSLQQ
ncbi:uncharacterized protein LOC144882512 [Branchiostoma floridae x Branchiostoma japonicum]